MKTNVNGNESFVLQLADSQWQAHLSCLPPWKLDLKQQLNQRDPAYWFQLVSRLFSTVVEMGDHAWSKASNAHFGLSK